MMPGSTPMASAFPMAQQQPFGQPQQPQQAQPFAQGPPSAQPFGQPQQAQPYGQSQQAQPYGQPQQMQPFAQPQQAQPFAQGLPPAQPFGQAQQAQPFGQPQQAQQVYGQPQQQQAYGQPAFGQPQQVQPVQQFGGMQPMQQQVQQQQQPVVDYAALSAPFTFIRPSVGAVPNSMLSLSKLGAPLSFSVQPMNDTEIPLVNGHIERCRVCRSYMNPFVRWIEGGRRWVCSLCDEVNQTSPEYMRPVDVTGKREDYNERPELSSGAVDFVATYEYVRDQPSSPIFLFAIDMSLKAIESGFTKASVEALQMIFSVEQPVLAGGSTTAKVSFVLFDESSVTVLGFDLDTQTTSMVVVADTANPFLPVDASQVAVYASDARPLVLEALTTVSNIIDSFQDPNVKAQHSMKVAALHSQTDKSAASTTPTASLSFSAVLSFSTILLATTGGHVVFFSSETPQAGVLKCNTARNISALRNTEEEAKMLLPDNNTTQDVITRCLGKNTPTYISVTVFLTCSQLADLASLAPVCQSTGGEIYLYPRFSAPVHQEKMFNELWQFCTKPIFSSCIGKPRISKGWKIASCQGPCNYNPQNGLVIQARTHKDHTLSFSAALQEGETIARERTLILQYALLYTTSAAVRLIRVHTVALPIVNEPRDAARTLDVVGALPGIVAEAYRQILTRGRFAAAHSYLSTVCQNASQYCSPDSFRHLATFCLGMMKHPAFRNDTVPDLKIWLLNKLQKSPPDALAAAFYPRLFDLANLAENDGFPVVDAEGNPTAEIQLPSQLPASAAALQTGGGVFLLEDGETIFVWVQKDADPTVLVELFDQEAASVDVIDPAMAAYKLVTLETPLAARVQQIIAQLRSVRPDCFMRVAVIVQGRDGERIFVQRLIEDRDETQPGRGADSLANFIQNVSRN